MTLAGGSVISRELVSFPFNVTRNIKLAGYLRPLLRSTIRVQTSD